MKDKKRLLLLIISSIIMGLVLVVLEFMRLDLEISRGTVNIIIAYVPLSFSVIISLLLGEYWNKKLIYFIISWIVVYVSYYIFGVIILIILLILSPDPWFPDF